METEVIILSNRVKELERENSLLRQQQIEITEAKELYLKIFEEFPALIWRSRLDKLCDYFNKTWLEFTGRTMEQEFGLGWAEGVHPDDYDNCVQTYVKAFDKRESFLMQYRMKNNLGEYRWINDFGRPFYDVDNTFLGYIGSCYDITDNKNNELKLIELNASKDKLFSIIAHDLKGPIANIKEISSIVNDTEMELSEVGKTKYLKHLENTTNNLYSLLETLLEWSMTKTDRIQFSPISTNLYELSTTLIKQLDAQANLKNISINNHIEANLNLIADPNLLKTILRNLISNSIKYCKEGGTIELSSIEEENIIRITLKDSGVGMSPSQIANLFKLSVNNSTIGTKNEKGTGLGLILCKEFMDKHQGKIEIESTVGNGSTFHLIFPKINPN
jgi:PAS domain S-box-containing protein